jgi:hypothetical protein
MDETRDVKGKSEKIEQRRGIEKEDGRKRKGRKQRIQKGCEAIYRRRIG